MVTTVAALASQRGDERTFSAFVVALLMAAAPSAASPTAPTCRAAVLDLVHGDGVTQERARALTEVVTGEVGAHLLADRGGCAVLSRAEIESLVRFEVERQVAGCDSDGCLAELGDALGVSKLVTGSVQKVDDDVVVSLRVIDMATMHVERRVTDSAASSEALVPFVRWVAQRLTRGDTAAGPRPTSSISQLANQQSPWTTAAWATVGVGGATLVLAGLSGAGAFGVQEALPALKTARDADAARVRQLEEAGPWLAGGANLGLYVSGALIVVGGALFFVPAPSAEDQT